MALVTALNEKLCRVPEVSTAGPLAGDIVVANCGQWPNAVANSLIYSAASNTWVQGGMINDNRRNEAGTFIPIGGKFKPYIVGGFGAATNFIDSIQTSEIGTPGANSSADRPVRVALGSSGASTS